MWKTQERTRPPRVGHERPRWQPIIESQSTSASSLRQLENTPATPHRPAWSLRAHNSYMCDLLRLVVFCFLDALRAHLSRYKAAPTATTVLSLRQPSLCNTDQQHYRDGTFGIDQPVDIVAPSRDNGGPVHVIAGDMAGQRDVTPSGWRR